MSSTRFRVDEHIIPCQHIREYPHATLQDQEDVLHLAIKQYTPLDNMDPKPGDVTILAAHANGFPKEMYEPLWDELLGHSKAAGFTIRSIWMADVAQQSSSGILNEQKLGNDPSWLDHSRDMLHMVNHFRFQMPRPLVGVGHSMGAAQLANLSIMHPRLLEALILIDPVIQRQINSATNFLPPKASAMRRDRWPSRGAAAAAFRKTPFYQAWDPRVLDLWIDYGLRDLPTALYPETEPMASGNAGTLIPAVSTEPTATPTPAEPEVTLATMKHQEVFTFLRPTSPLTAVGDGTNGAPVRDRRTHPDYDLAAQQHLPFYRPESVRVFHQMPFLRPGTLFVFGEKSAVSTPPVRADILESTGVGTGGSGGLREGRVQEVILKDATHFVAFERVRDTAESAAKWIGSEMMRWGRWEEQTKKEWEQLPVEERTKISPSYLQRLGARKDTRRTKTGAKL